MTIRKTRLDKLQFANGITEQDKNIIVPMFIMAKLYNKKDSPVRRSIQDFLQVETNFINHETVLFESIKIVLMPELSGIKVHEYDEKEFNEKLPPNYQTKVYEYCQEHFIGFYNVADMSISSYYNSLMFASKFECKDKFFNSLRKNKEIKQRNQKRKIKDYKYSISITPIVYGSYICNNFIEKYRHGPIRKKLFEVAVENYS